MAELEWRTHLRSFLGGVDMQAIRSSIETSGNSILSYAYRTEKGPVIELPCGGESDLDFFEIGVAGGIKQGEYATMISSGGLQGEFFLGTGTAFQICERLGVESSDSGPGWITVSMDFFQSETLFEAMCSEIQRAIVMESEDDAENERMMLDSPDVKPGSTGGKGGGGPL